MQQLQRAAQPARAIQHFQAPPIFGRVPQPCAALSGCISRRTAWPPAAAAARSRPRRSRCPMPAAAFIAPVLPTWVGPDADKYRFRTARGFVVYVGVQSDEEGNNVVLVSMPRRQLPKKASPQLHWGLYRSNTTWYHPEEVVPPGSYKDDDTGAFRTPFRYSKEMDAWEVQLVIPRRLAPVQLGFVLWFPEHRTFQGSPAGKHFAVPVGFSAGLPSPLGPSLVAVKEVKGVANATVNFAVFSRHATSMSICLMRRDGSSYLEILLDPSRHRTGDVWHCQLRNLKNLAGLVYGWRANGEGLWADGGKYHAAYIMLDPYCPVALPVALPQAAYDSAPLLPPEGAVGWPCLLGSLAGFCEDFDWEGTQRPRTALEDTVILEVDVEAFTTGAAAERAAIPTEYHGTYYGLLYRLNDILLSGATSVLLSNVFLSSSRAAPVPAAPPPAPAAAGVAGAPGAAAAAAPPPPPDQAPTLPPGWGVSNVAGQGGKAPQVRRPLSYFAPETRFAVGDVLTAGLQLKTLVKTLHEQGIEVLLEAEFCITSEAPGGISGRLQSMAGLDGDMYLRGGGGATATGVLNTGQPVVRSLVTSALHWWVEEYQVDGFCFVNAENLAQDPHGAVQDSPAIVEDLTSDPILRSVKLIAACGDDKLLPRLGVRGFPHYGVMLEWNQRFGATMLAFMRNNQAGLHSLVATRLTGSPDLLSPQWDADLPGGLAAGRRPGMGINALQPPLSGSLIRALYKNKVLAKSLLLAAMVAQGTPAFNAPTLENPELRRFVGCCVELRKRYQALLAPPMFDSPRDIKWHGAIDGTEPDWTGLTTDPLIPGANYIAFSVSNEAGDAVYVGFNPAGDPCDVVLPSPGIGLQWRRLVDTTRESPNDVAIDGAEQLESHYVLNPKGALLLGAFGRKGDPDAPVRPSNMWTAGNAAAASYYSSIDES